MLNDPAVQVAIVGTCANASGAAIALYLWFQQRSERYPLFWALAWVAGTLRFLIHFPAESNPLLRIVEVGVLFPLLFFFNALGSYDMLPAKPWKSSHVVAATAVVMLAYGVAANMTRMPIEMSYAFVAAVFLFNGACLWAAYRATRLSGHAFAAITFLCWSAWFAIGLSLLGRDLARSVIGPLFNIPLELSLVVIAYQRRGRQLAESEHTLQKIFETAPTPIVITRPPRGEIERANAVAFDMLKLSPESSIGKTTAERGVIVDAQARQRLLAELEAGRRVIGHEVVIDRVGEKRTLSMNADRLQLEGGTRYIFSFYDLTDLRRAEDELRASTDEMRRLYLRLANVEDDERRALHAELHDRVGANLAALRLELYVIQGLLTRADATGAQQHLDSAREIAAETMDMARDLMAELRPPALDDYGLLAGLRTFAELQSTRLGLPIDVAGEELQPRPSRMIEGALFRIAQEAVVNAARHACARGVAIAVGQRDRQVILSIEDDGVGFDLDAPGTGPDHWGLKNMRERAQAIGGTLHIQTAPGAGTRVVAQAPREAA